MIDFKNISSRIRLRKAGELPRYSARKKSRMTAFLLAFLLLLAGGGYLFSTYGLSFLTPAATINEAQERFQNFHKAVKKGERKKILAALSPQYAGGIQEKRKLLIALKELAKKPYTISDIKDALTPNREYLLGYTITQGKKVYTITNEKWKKNQDDGLWYLIRMGKGLHLSGKKSTGKEKKGTKKSNTIDIASLTLERYIPDGATTLYSLRNLTRYLKRIKDSLFYKGAISFLESLKEETILDKGLLEEALTGLLGKRFVIAHYKSSENFILLSRTASEARLLTPLIDTLINGIIADVTMETSSYYTAKIRKVDFDNGRLFYTLFMGHFILSDSQVLLQNSVDLLHGKRDNTILNNTKVLTELTDLKRNYRSYTLRKLESPYISPKHKFLLTSSIIRKRIQKGRGYGLHLKKSTVKRFHLTGRSKIRNLHEVSPLLPADQYVSLTLRTMQPDDLLSDILFLAGTSKKKGEKKEENMLIHVIKSLKKKSLLKKARKAFKKNITLSLLHGNEADLFSLLIPVILIEETDPKASSALIKELVSTFKGKKEGSLYSFDIGITEPLVVTRINSFMLISLGRQGVDLVRRTAQKKRTSLAETKTFAPEKNKTGEFYTASLTIDGANIASALAKITHITPESEFLLPFSLEKAQFMSLIELFSVFDRIETHFSLGRTTTWIYYTIAYKDANITAHQKELSGFSLQPSTGFVDLFNSRFTEKELMKLFMTEATSGNSKKSGFIYRSDALRDPFTPSYLLLERDKRQKKRQLQAEEEITKMESELLKPVVFDTLFLQIIKENDRKAYNKIAEFADYFSNREKQKKDTSTMRRQKMSSYRALFDLLNKRYKEERELRNKIPNDSLFSINLKGVAHTKNGPKALLVTPNRGYTISEGDYIGEQYYHVESITASEVNLKKVVFNYRLQKKKLEHTIELKK